MIFAYRGIDIDRYPSVKAHLLKFQERLQPLPAGWTGGDRPGRKPGSYQWYEIQDTIAYQDLFSRRKILYQDITFHSRFTLDEQGRMCNNTVYFLPCDSLWLLAVLNSPLLWSYLWRHAVHGKDEALRLFSETVETLPIAMPSDPILAVVEPAVRRLIALVGLDRELRGDLQAWLLTRFDVSSPGQRLEEFAGIDESTFVAEVQKRRPRKAAALTPASLRALKDAYRETAVPLQEHRNEASELERRLSNLVNEAYGLSRADEALLWETAPPRMPTIARPEWPST